MDDDHGRETAFARALRLIRDTIEHGSHSGQRILVTDLTRSTGLSPTPVREALSRLIGEELLVEHRGEGYFTPRNDARAICEMYRVCCGMGVIAVTEAATQTASRLTAASSIRATAQGALDVGSCMERLAVASGNSLLLSETRRLNRRMAGIRRAESQLIDDLPNLILEMEALVGVRDHAGQIDWIKRYGAAGISCADEISNRLAHR